MAGASEARAVGERLRAVRRLRQLSLEEVERRSGGRWSASAVGAYERGFRTLSLQRLRELAEFYGVPMTALLGQEEVVLPRGDMPERIVIDLDALGDDPEAASVRRYVRSIVDERKGRTGRTLAVRAGDVRALCSILQVDEHTLVDRLRRWGALV